MNYEDLKLLVEALESISETITEFEERITALEKLAAIHANILFHDTGLQDLEVRRDINWLPDGYDDRISVVDWVQDAIKRGKK